MAGRSCSLWELWWRWMSSLGGPWSKLMVLLSAWRLTLLCVSLAVLVIFNHYLAFQYFAEEYYLFSEVRDLWEGVDPCSSSLHGAAGGRRERKMLFFQSAVGHTEDIFRGPSLGVPVLVPSQLPGKLQFLFSGVDLMLSQPTEGQKKY